MCFFVYTVVLILTVLWFKRLLFTSETKSQAEFFSKLPQIMPHRVWGNENFGEHCRIMKGLRFGVWYTGRKRQLLILDPELANRIEITEFDHFMNVNFFDPEYSKCMGNQIGVTEATGETWKSMKKSVSGPFSLVRLKKYITAYNECNKQMLSFIDGQLKMGKNVIHSSNIFPNISMDVLALVGLGVKVNSFEDPNNEFKRKVDNIFDTRRWECVQYLPNIAKLLRIKAMNPDSVGYIRTIIKRTMKQRMKDGILGNDILGAFIKHKEENPTDENFDAMLNTYVQFIGDGNFTLAGLLGANLYYIIANPDVYFKLVEEQEHVFGGEEGKNGELAEEKLNELSYLDMVILETSRLVCFERNFRTCTKPWRIPDTDLIIPIGTEIVVPVAGIHKDPGFWESPEDFNPERFSSQNKGKIKSGTYLPFGSGPRHCLGMNYARLHIKITITHILRNYELHNFENLPKVMKRPHPFAFLPSEGLNLKFSKRV